MLCVCACVCGTSARRARGHARCEGCVIDTGIRLRWCELRGEGGRAPIHTSGGGAARGARGKRAREARGEGIGGNGIIRARYTERGTRA